MRPTSRPRHGRSLGSVAAAAAALTGLLASAPAHADLRDDAARVARLWTSEGALVRRLDPAFLELGRARMIDLAGEVPAEGAGPCVTFVAIAPRTSDFAAVLGAEDEGDGALLAMAVGEGGNRVVGSEAGALFVSRCGASALDVARAVVVQRAPRGTIELLVARSKAPLSPIDVLLPERVAGPAAPRGTAGKALTLGPIDGRLARAEFRAKADGAQRVQKTRVRPPSTGRGDVALTLEPGCHRIELLAEAAGSANARVPTDVDAELRLPPGQVAARDRGDASDARLDACVGEQTAGQLSYAGAPGSPALHVTDAIWPLPDGIPSHWGPRLRAATFSALRRRRMPIPVGPPLHETFGVQGVTVVPLEVEPDRCYLATAGLVQGSARGMRLAATGSARPAIDESGQRPEGVAVTFCPDVTDVVPLTMELQSSGGWWLLAVWDLGPASAEAASESRVGATP